MDWLGFFNGWRLVPIIMAFVALLFAALCLWVWPPVGDALESFSDWMDGLDAWGAVRCRRRHWRSRAVRGRSGARRSAV
ncbi:phosphotransferase system glucose/maltose/N-acetylglucosamine-specific IIC component [Streptomyces luteogriseus]|uniref:Phosphotransferase system glucose/maltose/N-acetylglucosamine-specific IIC component n=1 Tax=Streptomyces luteogriseus TaxID=68233 RepID=A0A7W7GH22_9ACTN|nr:phosphotransferase system glucose/maltose/N-acetylglucosamine-specific IIC component [Streptomyces luteogriseus]